MPKLKIIDGLVYNEEKTCVAVMADLPPDEREEIEKAIQFGSEAAPALVRLMEKINSGSFKPRQIVKDIENIYNKYK